MNKRFVALVLLIGLSMTSTALAVNYSPGTGQNLVPVQHCQQVGKDVRIIRNNQTYILSSACRNAGHGLRDYTLTCSGTKKYLVTWKNCNSTVPAATPKPKPTPAPTPAPIPQPNSKPIITVSGGTTALVAGGNFTYPKVTAFDTEDGNITASIKSTGSVNTQVAGTYTITYSVSDSKGLAAEQKNFTATVSPKPAETGAGNKTCSSHVQCNDNVAHTVDWCHTGHCHNDTTQCTSNTQCQTNGVSGYTCGKPFGDTAPSFCTK